MVTSVTSTPYFSYLNQLNGSQGTGAGGVPATGSASPQTAAAATLASSSGSSGVSALLGGGTGNFSSEILSLLQQNGTGSFDPITTLLGGTSTYNPLTSIFANLFASTAAASLAQAQTDGTAQAKANKAISPVQNLVNGFSQAAIAYNKTLIQNSQNIVKANSYQADGITPLVA